MDIKYTACLINDSFPPVIDGVATTVVNYARFLPESGISPIVVTPDHPVLIHSHCPITSTFLGRLVRRNLPMPMILTYHSKFDVDFSRAIKSRAILEYAARRKLEDFLKKGERASAWTDFFAQGFGETSELLPEQEDKAEWRWDNQSEWNPWNGL